MQYSNSPLPSTKKPVVSYLCDAEFIGGKKKRAAVIGLQIQSGTRVSVPLCSVVKGGFFLRKKPLGTMPETPQKLENRRNPQLPFGNPPQNRRSSTGKF
jgi:hypothetical protein